MTGLAPLTNQQADDLFFHLGLAFFNALSASQRLGHTTVCSTLTDYYHGSQEYPPPNDYAACVMVVSEIVRQAATPKETFDDHPWLRMLESWLIANGGRDCINAFAHVEPTNDLAGQYATVNPLAKVEVAS